MTTIAPSNALLDVLANRRSTRVFDAQRPVDESALSAALEAARWAPSAANTQPWRLIVARRGTEAFSQISDALTGFNQVWAVNAGALVVFLADTEHDGVELPWAEYDAGQAAAHFTVQAHADGLMTHQMGGFDRDAIAAAFSLPETIRPLTVMAVGNLGDLDAADDAVREREAAPRTRRPLTETVLVDA